MKLSWRSMTEKLIMEEAKSFEKMLRSAEAKEAFSAFFDRRKPDFSRFT
jgi:enoyl-CoA hydratase/carnithine racemase